jgi:hypothetical protein
LQTDGTFDQEAPLNRLIKRVKPGTVLHSIDLTAATDRIPVEFLCQILSSIGVDSKLWRKLICIPFFYEGSEINYAVGQPMGAYSSWAMLGSFNHVLIRIAALRHEIQDFTDYCVLGDDVVIANDIVANEYRSLLTQLGIGVSDGKCIISTEIAEFAKRLTGPKVDFTPLGAGLILQAVRRPILGIGALKEMYRLNIITYLPDLSKVLVK